MFLSRVLNNLLNFCVVIFLSSCATGGDVQQSNGIIQRGQWFLLSTSDSIDTYFDPYVTTRDANGIVETYIYAKNKFSGEIYTTDTLKVNCSERMIQYLKITATGGWLIYRDWFKPETTDTANGWINGLCSQRNPQGEVGEFIGLTSAKPPMPLTAWYWTPELSLIPSVVGGKTVKVYIEDVTKRTFTFHYFYSDCNKRRYAYSANLSLDKLSWSDMPPSNSIYGYVLNRSCGFNPSVAQIGSTKPVVAGSSNLSDTKAKCSDLGFKKGTEQFGNCVLKLSK